MSSFAIAPPPMSPQASGYGGMGFQQQQSQSQQQQATGQKSGLDKYQSLI
jgi:hypothetical protein